MEEVIEVLGIGGLARQLWVEGVLGGAVHALAALLFRPRWLCVERRLVGGRGSGVV